ncbi:hypothetical protein UY3_14518 [Chelonia mydas]|uniref:Uncharacterized protein n=1 Tax=Chelonia mydas TaxID=8469 RepID=M7B8A1_CHEMY|nr:hypothetical protein UY3_14518 [Chelonia mydas]
MQCCAKIKALRQAYQKARTANRCSGAVPKTCHFFKELDAILGSDPTSTATNPMDTLERLEAADNGANTKDKVVDKEFELKDNVEHTTGPSGGVLLLLLTRLFTALNNLDTYKCSEKQRQTNFDASN